MSTEGLDRPIFHLAIPCRDLAKAEVFYTEALGCKRGRKYEEHVVFDFYGHQLVCHLAPDDTETEAEMYPRHFGIVFQRRQNYEETLERLTDSDVEFFREPFVRLEGRAGEHETFFVADPSNNVIEFKHYRRDDDIY